LTELVWLRIGTNGELVLIAATFGLHRMLRIFLLVDLSSSAQLHRVSSCLVVYRFRKRKNVFAAEGIHRSLDSAVVIVIGYGLHDHGVVVRFPVEPRIFTFPYCPDRLWGPPNLCLYRFP
jgi:hypothetical protein